MCNGGCAQAGGTCKYPCTAASIYSAACIVVSNVAPGCNTLPALLQDAAMPDAAGGTGPSERRAGLEEPRRSRDALDDRRRPREADLQDRRHVVEDAGRHAAEGAVPEAVPAPEVLNVVCQIALSAVTSSINDITVISSILLG